MSKSVAFRAGSDDWKASIGSISSLVLWPSPQSWWSVSYRRFGQTGMGRNRFRRKNLCWWTARAGLLQDSRRLRRAVQLSRSMILMASARWHSDSMTTPTMRGESVRRKYSCTGQRNLARGHRHRRIEACRPAQPRPWNRVSIVAAKRTFRIDRRDRSRRNRPERSLTRRQWKRPHRDEHRCGSQLRGIFHCLCQRNASIHRRGKL
jgi:hypothetical protein